MRRIKQNQAIYMVLVAIILGIVLTACGDSTKPAATVSTTTASAATVATTNAPTTSAVSTTSVAVIPTVTPTTVAATTATTIAISDTTTVANTTTTATDTTAVPTTPPVTTTSAATATPPPTANPANLNKIIYADQGKLYAIDTTNKNKTLLGSSRDGGFSRISFSPVTGLIAAASSEYPSVLRIFDLQGKDTQLFSNQPANAIDIDPTWAPDGKLLLFTRVQDSNKDQKFDVKDKHELWLAEATGANARKLADGQQGTWASDSKRIAFVTDPKGTSQGIPADNALHLINSEGKNEWEPINTKKIPSDWSQAGYPFGVTPTLIQYPAFVDGGKKIAFTGASSGVVLSVNAFDGKDVKLWGGNPEGGYGKVWGLGNLMLVESMPPSGIQEVDIYDASGTASATNPPLIRIGGVRQNFNALLPAFSPDGKRVAFIKTTANSESALPFKGTLVVATIKDNTLGDQVELTTGTFWDVTWG